MDTKDSNLYVIPQKSGVIKIGDREFSKLSSFINTNYGIKLPDVKRTMLQARLQKRLKENNLSSFKDYCDLVFSDKGEQTEIVHMIDMVSTNKTDFFRESSHFDFMKSTILPAFSQKGKGILKVWSAACSSGEEVYTIGMVISEFIRSKPGFDYATLGSDISQQMLQRSSTAVYSMKSVEMLPMELKKRYLLKKKAAVDPDVRIVPELRSKVQFQRVNLMSESYQVPADFDIIFCRNVLIYFEREVQELVIWKLLKHLKPGGYLFLGHSESIMGMNLPINQIKPTIYQKRSL
ncbi:MAG: CheR family methyltransferase [Ekhidna sp.]